MEQPNRRKCKWSVGATKRRPKMSDPGLLAYRVDPYSAEVLTGNQPSASKKVKLAVGLLILGTVLLCTGVGVYFTQKAGGIPLMVIGSLAFTPGFYYSFVAWRAWRGDARYSFDSIPDV